MLSIIRRHTCRSPGRVPRQAPVRHNAAFGKFCLIMIHINCDFAGGCSIYPAASPAPFPGNRVTPGSDFAERSARSGGAPRRHLGGVSVAPRRHPGGIVRTPRLPASVGATQAQPAQRGGTANCDRQGSPAATDPRKPARGEPARARGGLQRPAVARGRPVI